MIVPIAPQSANPCSFATGTKLGLPSLLTFLADAYGMAGQHQEGLDWLPEAASLMETTQARWIESEMHRVRGTLLLSMGEREAAEDSYGYALAMARRQSARFFELRAGLRLAQLWRDQGKRAPKPAIFCRRSTASSRKDWTRSCCETPRRCSISWRNVHVTAIRAAMRPRRSPTEGRWFAVARLG
jgi:hypothetical protein